MNVFLVCEFMRHYPAANMTYTNETMMFEHERLSVGRTRQELAIEKLDTRILQLRNFRVDQDEIQKEIETTNQQIQDTI